MPASSLGGRDLEGPAHHLTGHRSQAVSKLLQGRCIYLRNYQDIKCEMSDTGYTVCSNTHLLCDSDCHQDKVSHSFQVLLKAHMSPWWRTRHTLGITSHWFCHPPRTHHVTFSDCKDGYRLCFIDEEAKVPEGWGDHPKVTQLLKSYICSWLQIRSSFYWVFFQVKNQTEFMYQKYLLFLKIECTLGHYGRSSITCKLLFLHSLITDWLYNGNTLLFDIILCWVSSRN